MSTNTLEEHKRIREAFDLLLKGDPSKLSPDDFFARCAKAEAIVLKVVPDFDALSASRFLLFGMSASFFDAERRVRILDETLRSLGIGPQLASPARLR